MKVRKIYYSSHFEKAFKKMPKDIQKKAVQSEKLFRENCFDSRLETHKLKGKLSDYWSFSITYSVRVLFEFGENGEVGFVDIGDHSIYGR